MIPSAISSNVTEGPSIRLLTVAEVAYMLKLSRSKVYELKEDIGCYKLGGAVRFRTEDVLRYLDERKVGGNGHRKPAPRPRLRHITV